jgi:hypothetical protein
MSSVEWLAPDVRQGTVRRFAVAWRNRVQGTIHDVAVLDVDQHTSSFRFQYLESIASVIGFRPFIGFPELDRVYESPRLWPFFDLRVMDRKRPDYPQYVGWLGLPEDADRVDILSRSGGEQKGDTVSLVEAPHVAADGATAATFLVRGTRYAVHSNDSADTANRLLAGDQLTVLDDETNEANPDALLLTVAGDPIGWIPDLLVEYGREVVKSGGTVTVLQNNGLDAPWHMRFLVRLTGRVAPGWSTFTDGHWPAQRSSAFE